MYCTTDFRGSCYDYSESSLTHVVCCVPVVTDISLFDELDNLGDADELLEALENAGYVSNSSI